VGVGGRLDRGEMELTASAAASLATRSSSVWGTLLRTAMCESGSVLPPQQEKQAPILVYLFDNAIAF
jgi:hypothetical protein